MLGVDVMFRGCDILSSRNITQQLEKSLEEIICGSFNLWFLQATSMHCTSPEWQIEKSVQWHAVSIVSIAEIVT